ncbi:MAG: zinc-dependent metalloprotease [Candidatus Marinimicrobia bacterium]|nr:zinc-dependent metalloprotease [Candidatus Neomarinimicrobiota bacterium]
MAGYVLRIIPFIFISITLLMADPFKPLDTDFLNSETPKKKTDKPAEKNGKKDKSKKKAFDEIIKDYEKIEGLFTFYWSKEKNKVYLSIPPEQFDNIYLAGLTRQSGDGYRYDGASMMGEYAFFLKQVGEKVQLVEENVKFRADKDSPSAKALDNLMSNSILASSKIEGAPDEKTGAVLVSAESLFLRDFAGTGNSKRSKFKLDKSNSYYESIQSFPFNAEIGVALHFTASSPRYTFTLPDSKSAVHRYHMSWSEIPSSNYSPRLADDRVGHFLTMHQDYTNIYQESPYVRYVNRWDLEKADPTAELSKPKQPIVYWLENTIPDEFRGPIREGILAWNEAFEAIGFKDAVVAKQMPDDATWNPADVRYSTIRWMIQPGSAYAVGPSRANPYTGELYDADIRLSADFFRFYYNDFYEFVQPIVGHTFEDAIDAEDNHDHHENGECSYAQHLSQNIAFSWNSLFAKEDISDGDKKLTMERFVHDGIVDLVLHEVGHTLGLRHNFKASSVYTVEQLSDPSFTKVHGVTGSVMDYNASSLLDGGHTFFQTHPGPYDYWAIEYAYAELPFRSELTEAEFLENIALKSSDPHLVYGTDEDTFGSSTRSIDPYASSRDLSADPIEYYTKQLGLVHGFWDDLLSKFEKEGERYPRIRNTFSQGLWEFYGATRNVSKFIGGIQHSRHHVGEMDRNPFVVIPADDQRRALQFLDEQIMGADVFSFDADLLNKLAPERLGDFQGSIWDMSRLDFPIHSYIKSIQRLAIYRIYHPNIINRVQDNELRFDRGEDVFTLEELFTLSSKMVWRELYDGGDVNSFRRNLQTEHVKVLSAIMKNESGKFPNDAIALARNDMNILHTKMKKALDDNKVDEYTHAHYQDNASRIQSVYKARTILN